MTLVSLIYTRKKARKLIISMRNTLVSQLAWNSWLQLNHRPVPAKRVSIDPPSSYPTHSENPPPRSCGHTLILRLRTSLEVIERCKVQTSPGDHDPRLIHLGSRPEDQIFARPPHTPCQCFLRISHFPGSFCTHIL